MSEVTLLCLLPRPPADAYLLPLCELGPSPPSFGLEAEGVWASSCAIDEGMVIGGLSALEAEE